VAITHTRLDLLSTDLEEEREHVLTLLRATFVIMFCLGVGVVLLTILFVVAFWDSHRLLVLGVFSAFFLLSGLAAWSRAVHRSQAKPKLFAASLAELRKDRDQLSSRP
jgi:uncharacterized membrane protein YqjE